MPIKTKFCLFVFALVLFGCIKAKNGKSTVYNVCISAPEESCIASDNSFSSLDLKTVASEEFGIDLLSPKDFKKAVEESVVKNAKIISVDYVGANFDIFYTEFFRDDYAATKEMNDELFELLMFGAKNVNRLDGAFLKEEKDAAILFHSLFPNRKSRHNLVFIESEFVAMKYENGDFVIAYRGRNNDSLVIGEMIRK